MRVFNFGTDRSEESFQALIEFMKMILINCFGNEHQGSICSILDDTNYIITKKSDMLFDFDKYEKAIFDNVAKILPIKQSYNGSENEAKNIIFYRECLDGISKILEYHNYEQLVRTYNEFERGGALTEKIKGDIAEFCDKFINDSKDAGGENSGVKLVLKTFIDNYDSLIKETVTQKYIWWKGLTYQPKRQGKNTWVANRLAYIYARAKVLSNNQDEYVDLIESKDIQGLAEALNISPEQAKNLADWYKDVCETLKNFNSSFTKDLNNFIFESEFYKNVCKNELLSRDQISDKSLSDFIVGLKEMLFLDTKTAAFIHPVSNSKNCAHRLFCVLKNNSSTPTIVHEFIHLISSSLARNRFFGGNDKYCDKVGFSIANEEKEIGYCFNDFFTEYLAQKIVHKENDDSDYSRFIPFYKDFFCRYEKELKQSFMDKDLDYVYKLFGKKNFLNALYYADNLYEISEKYIEKMRLIENKDVSQAQKQKIIENIKKTKRGERALKWYTKIKDNLAQMAERADAQIAERAEER